MQFAVGDVDEARDVAAQVDQRVQFDRRLGRAEWRPRKQRQAQVDGGGIERVDGFLEVHAEGFVDVEPARDANQMLGELGIDAPVARFVRIGQRAARHRSANTQVIELGRLRTQAGLDVAQALAIGQLREGHAAELIRATEIAHAMIAAVALDDAAEASSTEDDPSTARTPICQRACASPVPDKATDSRISRSNRRQPKNGSLLQPISTLRKLGHVLPSTTPRRASATGPTRLAPTWSAAWKPSQRASRWSRPSSC